MQHYVIDEVVKLIHARVSYIYCKSGDFRVFKFSRICDFGTFRGVQILRIINFDDR